MKTLYAHRPLLNADEVIEWAKSQGFKTALPPESMHVTLCYSKTPMLWPVHNPDFAWVEGGIRTVEQFNDNAVVLTFESSEMTSRNAELRAAGASSSFSAYRPHVTITYDRGDVNLANVAPYKGTLMFEGEVFEEVKENWMDDLVEKEGKFELEGSIEKYDAEQGRAFGIFSVVKVGDTDEIDDDGDRIRPEELEEAAYKHVMESRAADVNHVEKQVGELIESMVLTPEKCAAFQAALRKQGIDATIDVPAVVWLGGHQVHDYEVRKDIKEGRLRAYSMGGRGVRTPITE